MLLDIKKRQHFYDIPSHNIPHLPLPSHPKKSGKCDFKPQKQPENVIFPPKKYPKM
jgi:hypothetical protein